MAASAGALLADCASGAFGFSLRLAFASPFPAARHCGGLCPGVSQSAFAVAVQSAGLSPPNAASASLPLLTPNKPSCLSAPISIEFAASKSRNLRESGQSLRANPLGAGGWRLGFGGESSHPNPVFQRPFGIAHHLQRQPGRWLSRRN